MSRQPYLMNRNGHYYFRISVPSTLICKFDRKVLTYSLRTKCKTQAKLRCWAMFHSSHLLFRKIETMPRLTADQVKEITQVYFKECLKRMEFQFDTVDLYSAQLMKLGKSKPELAVLKSIDHTIDAGRLDFLMPDNFKYENDKDTKDVTGMSLGYHNHFNGDIDAVTEHIVNKNNLDVEEGTLSYNTVKKGAERAIKELVRLRDRNIDLDGDLDVLDDWFKTSVSMPQVSLDVVQDISGAPLISETFKEFLQERNEEKLNTLAQKQSACDLWIELHGDGCITNITAPKVREFKNTLDMLPKNRGKARNYKDKSLSELKKINIPTIDKMAVGTKNGYVGTMSTFMGWLQNQYSEYNIDNHFVGKRFKDTVKKKDKRNPFSEDQLKALLKTPIYKGCAGDNQFQRYQKGSIIIKDSLYWVPVIAMYTGARMEEILRLRPCDIYEGDGVWTIDINEDDGHSRKTTKSIRKVPIHSKLIEFGILEQLSEIKKKKKTLIFCDTPKARNGTYSKEYSKKFSRMLIKYDIKTKKTSFHSFRHSFKDQMVKAQISKELRTAIMGQEFEDTHDNTYGGVDVPIKILSEAIEKVEYPFITIKNKLIKVV